MPEHDQTHSLNSARLLTRLSKFGCAETTTHWLTARGFEKCYIRTPSGTRTIDGPDRQTRHNSSVFIGFRNKSARESLIKSSRSVTLGEPFDRFRTNPTQGLTRNAESSRSRRFSIFRVFRGAFCNSRLNAPLSVSRESIRGPGVTYRFTPGPRTSLPKTLALSSRERRTR